MNSNHNRSIGNPGGIHLIRKRGLFHFFLAAIFSGIFFSCENSIEKVNLISKQEVLPVELAKSVEIIYSDSGKVSMRLTAPELERYDGEEPFTEFKKGIKVVFYNSRKKPESQITANYAIKYDHENKMIAKDDVVVINKVGEKLNTEHLIWNEETKEIHTEGFVRITTEDEIIYGDGMVSNQDFTQYQIKNIKGIIQVKDEDNEDDTIP